jgi:YggT family protein
MAYLATFIHLLFTALIWAILLRVILSWVGMAVSHPLLNTVARVLDQITEPLLAPIRRFLPAMAGLDLSPLIALVLLSLLERFVLSLL